MSYSYIKTRALYLLAGCSMLIWWTLPHAAPPTTIPRTSDIQTTKHNLSITGPGSTKAITESQICVFCHTPHGANADATALKAPLWNRNVDPQSYTPYSSSSTQANIDSNPGGASKLCLSCHDGTLAIGSVNVLNGQTDASIDMTQTIGASGAGDQTGFTRLIGTNLSNDHPISFDFDTSTIPSTRLAAADGELRDPENPDGSHIRISMPGDRPPIPLDHEGKTQCTSCHDPHISGLDQPAGTTLVDSSVSNIKFLRGRRFQMNNPLGGNYVQNDDIICLACHDKGGQDWSMSVHADQTAADETYLDTAADLRDFPRGIEVWQAACMNCHDTHTVEGARRLVREGTDDLSSPKSGGSSALEETCYQCHTNTANSILSSTGNNVPNIEDDFTLKSRRMPITTPAQPAATEIHDIVDADMTESRANLGEGGNLTNRHAECTDCHNPHRVVKNSQYDGGGVSSQATHDHTTLHSNEASGALKGTFGVEPNYSGRQFGTSGGLPLSYTELTGTGGNQVTKEYQICLKCHSDYAYDDDGGPDNAIGTNTNGRPETGGTGLTPYSPISTINRVSAQTNSFRNYTSQAMEFQAPSSHKGQASNGVDGGACGTGAGCENSNNYNTNNHRSWHPVIDDTGRTTGIRNADAANWLTPFNSNVGLQTMYCTDCHGSDNGSSTNVIPSTSAAWGPHGSNRNFILKGTWPRGSARVDNNGNLLCYKCHDQNDYGGSTNEDNSNSGFGGGSGSNLHSLHRNRVGRVLDCMWCHVAVPHGWKNKALLVNLNDIGPEVMCRTVDTKSGSNNGYDVRVPGGGTCTVGQPIPRGSRVGTTIGGDPNRDPNDPGKCGGGNCIGNDTTGYNNPPYYVNARLRIQTTFATSGNWAAANCGGKDFMSEQMCGKDTAGH